MLNLTFANYTIKRMDQHNITLSVTRPKQVTALHKEVSGNTTEIIGYYGTLDSALKSLLNRYVLDESNSSTAEEVLKAISRAESLIKTVCTNNMEVIHEDR